VTVGEHFASPFLPQQAARWQHPVRARAPARSAKGAARQNNSSSSITSRGAAWVKLTLGAYKANFYKRKKKLRAE